MVGGGERRGTGERQRDRWAWGRGGSYQDTVHDLLAWAQTASRNGTTNLPVLPLLCCRMTQCCKKT